MSDVKKVRSIFSKFMALDQIANVEVDNLTNDLNCFQSVKSVKVNFKGNGEAEHYVVKCLSDAPYRNQYFKSFQNESVMYNVVLPSMSDKAQFLAPKFFYATPVDRVGDEDTAIVLSNLSAEGYESTCNKDFLTIDEAKAALKILGFYHGEGYSLKFKNKLEPLTEKLQNQFFDIQPGNMYEFSRNVADASLLMFLDRLIGKNLNEQLIIKAKKMKAVIRKKSACGVVKELRKPVEPYAVLCHGDFNANNLLFKKTPDGNVLDCKMIDFQLPVYTQPQIDMVLMLFMNLKSPEERANHWDDLLKTYHDALVERIKYIMGATFDIPEYLSLNTFKTEMPTYLFHAMFIINFFFPFKNNFGAMNKRDNKFKELRIKTARAIDKHHRYMAGEIAERSADEEYSHLDELKYDPKMEEMVTPFMSAFESEEHQRCIDEVLSMNSELPKMMDDWTEEFLTLIDERLYE